MKFQHRIENCVPRYLTEFTSLPLDLLALIAFKLEFFEDFIYFSAVCRTWNSAWSTIKQQWRSTIAQPWLLLAENTKDNPNCARNMFNLNNNKRYKSNLPETSFGGRCWGSPYGWVAVAKGDHTIQLINPITKANISFPSLETILKLCETNAEYFENDNLWCLTYFLEKLIVLKVSDHGGRNEFVIMIICNSKNNYLAFARQGDQSWTSVLLKENTINIFDVAAIDDHVYVLYDDGAIAYWNVKEFYGSDGVKAMDYSPGEHKIFKKPAYRNLNLGKVYLIQSGTDLLMVLRFKEDVMNGINQDDPGYNYDFDVIYRTVIFEVYKLNLKEKKWEYLEDEDLVDVNLFVGGNTSMSTLLAPDKTLRGSCIYFTDDQSQDWIMVTELGGHDMGLYDVHRDELGRLYDGIDTRSLLCPPTFFIPQF